MNFSEIIGRLTGISAPVFGVSWHPAEVEVTAARRVISFLEDRRVLFNPTEMEKPAHCIDSVLEIRRFLTEEIGRIEPHDDLAKNLHAMRSACRKFLDDERRWDRHSDFLADPQRYRWSIGSWTFLAAIGDLRTTIGLHIALIAVRNGLDIASDLATILPGEPDDEGVIVVDV